MIAKKTSINELNKALEKVNEKYNDNVIWNREPEWYTGGIRFTLKVKDSSGKGAGRGDYHYVNKDGSRRKKINACWHVHGDFFDALFELNPQAEIVSLREKITKDFGNWKDKNIGSVLYPFYMSDACLCGGVE